MKAHWLAIFHTAGQWQYLDYLLPLLLLDSPCLGYFVKNVPHTLYSYFDPQHLFDTEEYSRPRVLKLIQCTVT